MNDKMKIIIVVLVVAFLTIMAFIKVFSISTKTKENVLNAHNQMTLIKKDIDNEINKFNTFKKKKEDNKIISLLVEYSNKLELEKNFKEANNIYSSMDTLLKEIDIKIEENKSKDEDWIISKLKIFNKNKILITKKIKYPSQRISELKALIENTEKYKNSIETNLNLLDENFKEVETTLNKTVEKHKNKKEQFDTQIKEYTNLIKNCKNAASSFFKEYENEKKDYLSLEAFYLEFEKNKEQYFSLSSNFIKQLPQLYKSYSKILSDMKIDYYIEVGRSSWDEDSDWDSESTKIYTPIKITPFEYEQFSKVTGELAVMGGFFSSSIKPKISSTLWNKLGIKEDRRSLPGSDDSAVYWINDLPVKFYHKYTNINNNKVSETNWTEVSEDAFDKYENDLGMEIISKPYGYFENEKIVSSAPVGLNQVGNSHYGEWRQDSSGNSFWHYYGMYSFFSNLGGNNRYYDRDYRDYSNYRNSNSYKSSTGYYGKKNEYGTNGSRTKSSARYSKSNYSKSMKNSSFKNIRNAGSSSRGRGPSGGGK